MGSSSELPRVSDPASSRPRFAHFRILGLVLVVCLLFVAGCATKSAKFLTFGIRVLPEAQSVLYAIQDVCQVADCVQVAKELFTSESYPIKAEGGAPTDDSAVLIIIDTEQHTITHWSMTSRVQEILAVQDTPSKYALMLTQDPLRAYLWTENAAELRIKVRYAE